MPEQSNDYRVAVFGAGGVGKSSLVLRFVKGTFRESYIPTVEDTYRQVISCDKSICTLQITDTTGSHQFPAMQRLSISKGHAFILVYSITSRQSLEELKPIYEQICEIKGDVESIPIMLVGNKCDESPNREVQSSEAEALARTWKCAFMETSAKLNHNVKELFQELLNLEKRRTVSLQIDGKKSKQQKKNNLTADIYLIDWIFTLYSKSLPLDLACRIWDVFCRDGEEFLFRTALGILKLFEDILTRMDFIHSAQFLTRLPEDLPADDVFAAISTVQMQSRNKKWAQVLSALQKDSREMEKGSPSLRH